MAIDAPPRPPSFDEGVPEGLRGSVLLARLDDLVNWSRSNSLWPLFFGLSCCFVEFATSLTSRHDLSRFGSEVIRGSPRQADLLVIAGTVFKKMAGPMLRLYEQMLEPRWVISMGSCANSGGMYDVYPVVQGADTLLPVDVYMQGCPPRPEQVIEALVLLQKKIRRGERPAAEIVGRHRGETGTTRPPLIEGLTVSLDPRGPGLEGTRPRGTIMRPGSPFPAAYFEPWSPPTPLAAIEHGLDEVEATLTAAVGPVSRDPMPSDTVTWRVRPEQLVPAAVALKPRFRRLEFACGIDNRPRGAGFRSVYQFAALEPGKPMLRLAVDLPAERPHVPTLTGVLPVADWYEREMLDLFGIVPDGHPDPRRLYMPSCWEGHPMRKDHPSRATEMAPFTAEDAIAWDRASESYSRLRPGDGRMVLSLGPHHPATHGVIRFILLLDGENITDLDIEAGYHHRAPEKIAERQTYHKFVPYTDRVDYLGGVTNNLPYCLSVERLLGIRVPERAQMIRVMMSELFRISSHLVYIGTLAQDAGANTPVFFTFEPREQILDFVAKVTGGRMHPSWFRIGGVAQDLPDGWRDDLAGILRRFPAYVDEFERLLTGNDIFVHRARGTGALSRDDAIDLGFTGPNLRAAGMRWDLRRDAPYSGYEKFTFDVPVGSGGDNYERYLVHMAELRQSHRILEQCLEHMPDGEYVSQDYRYVVPDRDRMLYDIETLIHHFINVSRGFEPEAGEAYVPVEQPKGEAGYYVISDGTHLPYRVFIRTPSFPHIQSLGHLVKGGMIADFAITLGAIDYVLADVDK